MACTYVRRWHTLPRTTSQAMSLLVLNVTALAYLLACRPYIVKSLQRVEVACHTLALISCACAPLFGETLPDTAVYALQWSLIGEWSAVCLVWFMHHTTFFSTGAFASTALMLVAYEVWKMLGYVRSMLNYAMTATRRMSQGVPAI